MTDESQDKTEEIREAAGDDGALGGSTDSDGGAILTLDGDSDSSDGEGESEGVGTSADSQGGPQSAEGESGGEGS